MSQKKIEIMPSISTASRMALESGVISDLQSEEVLESASSNILACDATDILMRSMHVLLTVKMLDNSIFVLV